MWLFLNKKVRKWQMKHGKHMHLFVGPAFDYNYDGLKDQLSLVDK